MTQPATSPSSRPARGAELELTVDSLAHGGNGVARLDGYVVFVAGALPGDRVRAVVHKSKRAYAEARATELLAPGPDRVPAVADHPGAPWQELSYERQLEVKQQQVHDALTRIGGFAEVPLEPIVPAVEPWRYRNKVEYSFGADPDSSELICGFHAPGRFDRIIPMGDCKLVSERSNRAREQVLAWCRERGLEPWDRRTQLGMLRNLVVREGRRTGGLQVRLVTSQGDIGAEELVGEVDCEGLLWTQMDSLGESTYGGDTVLLDGSATLHEQLSGLDFHISPDAFFQTNTEMAERLYALAAEAAQLRGSDRVFDLYCGIGSIGLTLAARAREVIGVELVEDAVTDATHNARLNGIDNARFLVGDIRLAMRELLEREGRPDVVLLDPPRAGLSQKVVRRVVEARAARIVYVSCNPTTLAPNAKQLVEAGYTLRTIRPVDMFPQTPHIECVALFEGDPATVANPEREEPQPESTDGR